MPLCLQISPHEASASVMEEPIQKWEGISEGLQRAGLSKSTHSVAGIIRHQNAGVLTLKSLLCLTQPLSPPTLLFLSLSPRPTPHVKLCVCHCCSHAGKRARDPGDQLSWLLVPRPVSLGCGFLFA